MKDPAGLYIHIPFCLKKCHYCSFWSVPARPDEGRVQDYVDALIRELQDTADPIQQEGVRTLYIGGGTPSMLPARLLSRLLEAVENTAPRITEDEYTLEANPGTLVPETLTVLRDSRVNRMSLGIQSDQDEMLARLGRIHTWDDARRSYFAAREAGLEQISVDLIYGLPGQSRADWQQTLARVGALAPDHMSAYGLQVEEGTMLAARVAAGEWTLPDEETEADMAADTVTILSGLGLDRYEISSYCRRGRKSRHNQIYWRNEPYRGIGAGAFSYVNRTRSAHVQDPDEYIRRVQNGQPLVDWQETLTLEAEMEETMMMSMRLTAGLTLIDFQERFGADPREVFADPLAKLTEEGLLCVDDTGIRPTGRGLDFNNRIGREFIGSLT